MNLNKSMFDDENKNFTAIMALIGMSTVGIIILVIFETLRRLIF